MAVTIKTGLRDDAFAVRRAVFMDEQGYENEFEPLDDDPACIHLTAYLDDALVGCARVFPEPLEHTLAPGAPHAPASHFEEGIAPDQVLLLGRVAVLAAYRRQGIAAALTRAALDAARAAGARVMKLHAQEYVQALYAHEGFEAIAPVDYEDEGQPHVWMARTL